MWNLKRNDINELTKQKQTHRLKEWTYGWGGGCREGMLREFGTNMYTLLYLKWMINKDIAQGTLLNAMWQPRWHRNLEKNGYMYMYGWVTSLFTWNNHSLVCLLIGYVRLRVLVIQSCSTLCDSVDCSLPGSSAHGILQANILEWVAISFSRESSQLMDWTWVSHIAGRFFILWVTRDTPIQSKKFKKRVSVESVSVRKWNRCGTWDHSLQCYNACTWTYLSTVDKRWNNQHVNQLMKE